MGLGQEEFPTTFSLAMPDGALFPRTPAGVVLYFDRSRTPAPGAGVLVSDGDGRRYVRRYAEGPGGTWLAQATDPAYITLASDRDRLIVIACVTGREDPAV